MILFESNWDKGLGSDEIYVTDGGKWDDYADRGIKTPILSVVLINGIRALRVMQQGEHSANIQKLNLLPLNEDYKIHLKMRNDDTSPSGDHIVTPDIFQYGSLTYVRRYATDVDWTFDISTLGIDTHEVPYPIHYWQPSVRLSFGIFYTLEYEVKFTSPGQVQIFPTIKNPSGKVIADASSFRQQDFLNSGDLSYQGKNDWTLLEFYKSGNSFPVDSNALRTFGLGNNGQQGALNTGKCWYFAEVRIEDYKTVSPIKLTSGSYILPDGTQLIIPKKS